MQINNKITNQQVKERDIHERIYKFVIRVIALTKSLPKNPQNDVIIYQIVKSVTSMGANDQEADGSESRKDFIAKYSIVKKENKETNYWLRVIGDTNPAIKKRIGNLQNEGLELVRIISAIILSAKRKI
ncbi:MAG: four helix bundle protein [Patescibacteria group bacterium]|nr:four helix bundle protein [Patescibacteria group bacterium]